MQPIDLNPGDLSFRVLQEDLRDALLEEEEVYPWNLLDPEVDAYFDNLESQFDLIDPLDKDFNVQADSFFNTLHQQWSQFDPPSSFNHPTRSGT